MERAAENHDLIYTGAMQIWLETDDLSIIEKAQKMGFLHGIVTTPVHLAKAPDPQELVKSLLAVQSGPVVVEIGKDLVAQGKALSEFSKRIVVKIPVVEESWEAIQAFSKSLVPVMASAIFQPTQALLASLAGAHYVAPHFSRILTSGDNPLSQLITMKKMELKAKIIAVNPKTVEQVKSCAEIGLDGIILREDVFRDLTETHELTAQAVEQYADEWKKTHWP
jgi:transaldolase